MTLTTKIILAVIALHLLLGFGWLLYKLSPRKGDRRPDPGETPGRGGKDRPGEPPS